MLSLTWTTPRRMCSVPTNALWRLNDWRPASSSTFLARGVRRGRCGPAIGGMSRGGPLRGRRSDLDHTIANAIKGDPVRAEDRRGDTILLPQQAEEDVLDTEVVMPERPGLFFCPPGDVVGLGREALQHGPSIPRQLGSRCD